MSRDYFRNRIDTGAIRQFPVGPALAQTKSLVFDSSAELTDNFTQNKGGSATQNVTGGVLQFRSGVNDQQNNITSKFTMTSFSSVLINIACGATSSAATYHYPRLIECNVLNSSNAVVTSFVIQCPFQYTYSSGNEWNYFNSGYIYWRLGTDSTNTSGAATPKRLTTAPTRGMAYHTYELIDIGGGYARLKIDGTTVGSDMYLGATTYKLGGPVGMSPIDSWYNVNTQADLTSWSITYSLT